MLLLHYLTVLDFMPELLTPGVIAAPAPQVLLALRGVDDGGHPVLAFPRLKATHLFERFVIRKIVQRFA